MWLQEEKIRLLKKKGNKAQQEREIFQRLAEEGILLFI
jgi:hypothetical protein